MERQLVFKVLLEYILQKVNGMGIEPIVYPLLGYLLSVIGLNPVAMLLQAGLIAKQVVDQNHLNKCQRGKLALTLQEAGLPSNPINAFLRKQ